MSRHELGYRGKLWFCTLVFMAVLHPWSTFVAADDVQAVVNGAATRPVTVADAIRMTTLARDHGRIAQFSPDSTELAVLVKKGSLEQNTNQCSILLWKAEKLIQSPAPEVLVNMSSSSNRTAIADLRWMEDNEHLAFLGENPGEARQLYIVNVHTRNLKRITSHATSVLYYSMTPHADSVTYVADGPVDTLLDDRVRRDGVVVSTQKLENLIAGRAGLGDFGNNQLFLSDARGVRRLQTRGKAPTRGQLSISPDGKYILAEIHVETMPPSWKEYSDPLLQEYAQKSLRPGQGSFLTMYLLVDTSTGESGPLLNTPVRGSSFAWAPDSHSVVIAGAYLPLENVQGDERRTRQSKTFLVEVRVPEKQVIKIADEDEVISGSGELSSTSPSGLFKRRTKTINWDSATRRLRYVLHDWSTGTDLTLFTQKREGSWERLKVWPDDRRTPGVVLEEGMDRPPKLFAVDPNQHEKRMLLDLNPQFNELKFAKVEEIAWKGSDGHDLKGGLYYPIGFVEGKKYPLVIQTHGWNANRFWIDGPYTTAFAAQPLAGRGIMVLQADEIWGGSDFDTPKEVNREVSGFEGAIDELAAKGLVDPTRVGIIGFSRTGTFASSALTRSKYRFAAASVADGSDIGPFQFMLFANVSPDYIQPFERYYGGLPFGNALETWVKLSPAFNVDKVQTPLRLVATGPELLLVQWGWYASLLALGKPVEMVYLSEGTHVLEKPWDRMVSQQGNVDWFDFWLNGHEDSDPAKAEQYARWRKLRKLQEANQSPSRQ